MIVLGLGLAVSDADICPFTDVAKSLASSYVDPSDTNYPDHYVAVCAAHGITQGRTSTTFAPYDSITRQQLITMVVRAAGLADPPADFVPSFSVGQFYPEEHYANARKATYAGLLADLQGVGSTYDFLAPASRGECAQLLHNLIILLTPSTTSSTTTSSSTTTTTVPAGHFQSLGGELTSGPGISSTNGGNLHVFIRGPDSALWLMEYEGGRWTDWIRMEAVLTSDPATVIWDRGPIFAGVFFRGTDNAIWFKGWDNVWSPFNSSLGGRSPPARRWP